MKAGTAMKRPNHKLHKIKVLVRDFSREAFKGRNANSKKLFGIAGTIAKMGKAG